MANVLDGFDMTPAILEAEWVVTIDTPVAGVEAVLAALGNELPLVQGPYDPDADAIHGSVVKP